MPDAIVTRRHHRAAASVVAFAALFVAACGGGAGTEVDSGLLVPIGKDAGIPADFDASVTDASGGMDAFAPDAMDPPPPDRDQDGLPDALDPAPDVQNRLLFSDDFHAIAPEWLFTSTVMRIEPGNGVLKASPADGLVREGWVGPRNQWTDTIIHARVRLTEVGPGHAAGSGRGGIMGRAQAVIPDRYLICGIDQKQRTAFLAEHNGGLAEGTTLASQPFDPPTFAWVDVVLSMSGSMIRCKVGDQELYVSNQTFGAGSTGVRVFDASFEVDSIAVFSF